jgi:hypothetical protein
MPDDPKEVIEFAIRSAFVSYPKEDDPIREALTGSRQRNVRIWQWP